MKSNPKLTLLKDISFTLLGEGKTIRLKAEGLSMFPSIKPGSVIHIEPVTQTGNLQPGDIIAWKRSHGFVAHRLIRKYRKNHTDYFVTRGDCRFHEDAPVTAELIAGKVNRVEYPEGTAVPVKSWNKRNPVYIFNRISLILTKVFKH